MSKRSDIGSRLVYTCNCGWVDKGHALASSTRPFVSPKNLWTQILLENGEKSNYNNIEGFKVTYRQDMGTSVLGIKIMGDVTQHYFVKSGLSRPEKESVALAIFQEISYAFESYQGKFFLSSSYSAEDLVSNLIGFYNAIRPDIDHMTLCRPVSKKASLEVWDEYGAVGDNKNRHWGAFLYPCRECPERIDGPMSAPIPMQLQNIIPAKNGEQFRDWDLFLDKWTPKAK